MTPQEAILAYTAKFNEGPPIWGMDDKEALAAIIKAIETGKPITDTPDKLLPDDTYL